MKVILIDKFAFNRSQLTTQKGLYLSDCDCACPIDGVIVPVLSLPITLYLELTPACNNRCPGCSNLYAAERSFCPPSLTGDQWQTLIAQFAPHVHHIKLTGGEPTLHPNFGAIVSALNAHNISFAVFTNARWSDPECVLDTLCAAPVCDGLLISLHGPDAATHEAFTGVPGSFAETVVNIRRAVAAGLNVAASLVVTRHNWEQIETTLSLSLDLGVNHLVCNRWIGTPQLNLAPDPAQLREVVAKVEALRVAKKPIRFGNCIPQCFKLSSSTGCTAGASSATIDPWGRVRPCNHVPLIAGDLWIQSLEEIWHGEVMRHWRDMVPDACTACPVFATCHGGCRAQALLAGTEQDPLIEMPFPLPTPESEMRLWSGLRPVAQFTSCEDQEQLLLIHKSQVAIAPATLHALIPSLDGSLTLQQIQQSYGDAAVDWVGSLAQAGLVIWE